MLPQPMLSSSMQRAPSFTRTVLREFDVWDLNHDGKLSPTELDQAALNPEFRGADAVALAAVHNWLISLRRAKEPAPVLTKTWFTNVHPIPLKLKQSEPLEEKRKEHKVYFLTSGSLQARFVICWRRLRKIAKDSNLYSTQVPELQGIKQGQLGDCFFLAPLGAIVNRSPDAVRKMIQADGNGYEVQFGDGQKVQVGPLSETELLIGGSSTNEGLWVRVLENAYADRNVKNGQPVLTDSDMNGGLIGYAGRILTGHSFPGIRLVGDYKKQVSDKIVDTKLKRLRSILPKVLGDHRLVLAGTSKHEEPKSITASHAYAVIGYDRGADEIIIWDPHGFNFNPKGIQGLQNGYAMTNGIFSMPLPDFVHTFASILFESKKAIPGVPKPHKRS